ncbi:hypothetical protein ACJX0J_017519, partial [Zea mays]
QTHIEFLLIIFGHDLLRHTLYLFLFIKKIVFIFCEFLQTHDMENKIEALEDLVAENESMPIYSKNMTMDKEVLEKEMGLYIYIMYLRTSGLTSTQGIKNAKAQGK